MTNRACIFLYGVKVHPEYAEYRKQVPMLAPGSGGRAVTRRAHAVKVAPN
jgi:hypothetical protein